MVEALPLGSRACDWGCIRTSPKLSNPLRLGLIYHHVCQLITRWSPGLVVVEEAFVDPKHPRAALQLGEVRGTISVAAHNMGVEVFEIKPSEVKHALTGQGLAAKEQVQGAVNRILHLPIPPVQGGARTQPLSHHATDAMAIALTGLSRKGLLSRL